MNQLQVIDPLLALFKRRIPGFVAYTKRQSGATFAYGLEVQMFGEVKTFAVESHEDAEALELLLEAVDYARKDPRRKVKPK